MSTTATEKRSTSANGRYPSPSGNFGENLQSVAGDLADLAQLQAELFGVDARRTVRSLLLPSLLALVGGLVVATASLLAFAGLGLWLHTAQGFSLHVAFLLAAGGAFLFGLVCLGVAYGIVRWRGIPLSRSWQELKLNLAWTRRALFGSRNGASRQT